MKSNKQRRAELKAKKTIQAKKKALKQKESRINDGTIQEVDRGALVPDGSYGCPTFVERGYYVDIPFVCKDCGKDETWTAAQQKWWYEIAKGGVWTTARRCRLCRRRERERQNEARRVHLEGLRRKRRNGGND